MITIEHKLWLDNEYKQWVEALQQSTVFNFKEHPHVKRMLSEDINVNLFKDVMRYQHDVLAIDNIGREKLQPVSGSCLRMVYYALKVIDTLKELGNEHNHIIEIGGGCGQFYAVLKALGYEGEYGIHDLPEVQKFQREYLAEVEKRTGLSLPLHIPTIPPFKFCVSFYALGEFDDELKDWYIKNVVKKSEHGLILWNPHSGASSEIPFECTVTDENPSTSNEPIKQLVW